MPCCGTWVNHLLLCGILFCKSQAGSCGRKDVLHSVKQAGENDWAGLKDFDVMLYLRLWGPSLFAVLLVPPLTLSLPHPSPWLLIFSFYFLIYLFIFLLCLFVTPFMLCTTIIKEMQEEDKRDPTVFFHLFVVIVSSCLFSLLSSFIPAFSLFLLFLFTLFPNCLLSFPSPVF